MVGPVGRLHVLDPEPTIGAADGGVPGRGRAMGDGDVALDVCFGASHQVLTFMKHHKKGVSISKLKEGSGLSDKQISNILHRANKEGKIKRVARGVYQLA